MNNSVEYKNIGVDWIGSIPSNWKVSRFKHLFDEKKSTKNPELNSGSISFGQVIYKNDESIPESTKEGYQEVLEGEFLLNPLNLNYDLKSLRIALSRINVVVSQGYIVLKLRDRLHPNYYEYLLRKFDVEHMKSLGQGVRQTISFTHLKDENLVVPPIGEQKLISCYLDKKTSQIDSLVEKIQKKIDLLKEQRTSLINNYVTKGLDQNVEMKDSGVEWIGEIPEHWNVTRLKFCSTIVNGYAFKSDDFEMDNEIPVIRIGDVKTPFDLNNCVKVTKEIYEKHKDFQVLRGDILVGMTGGTIGKSASYDLEDVSLLNQRVCIFRSQINSDQKFLSIYMESKLFKEQITLNSDGGGQPNIGREELMNFDIFLPPLEEQIKIFTNFSSRTQKYQSLIDLEHSHISKLLEYRQSLISSVVTGKVRVTEDMK